FRRRLRLVGMEPIAALGAGVVAVLGRVLQVVLLGDAEQEIVQRAPQVVVAARALLVAARAGSAAAGTAASATARSAASAAGSTAAAARSASAATTSAAAIPALPVRARALGRGHARDEDARDLARVELRERGRDRLDDRRRHVARHRLQEGRERLDAAVIGKLRKAVQHAVEVAHAVLAELRLGI